jgi:hypothetical protein
MPSFLSKVFGRKKDDKESPRSQGRVSPSLLEGKFESVSPSATKFPEVPNGKGNGHGKEKEKAKEKEKDSFALFKAKSRPASPDALKKRVDIPQLSLNLPGPKEDSSSRALGVVFEGDPDAQILLGDSIMGERRLNPLETLILVHACTQAITARGTSSKLITYQTNTHLLRPRNSRDHAPSLVFCFSGDTAEAHIAVYPIFGS